ncbi:MAG: hypothetical protein C0598_06985 [Marinilabiliales bacterium]|nr:MAG: hypothetical protein C0598_06985 [Marinilabiliales bacterium]
MLENYYWLGELFEKQQDYKKALAYFKKYEELERVILAEKQLAEINQLEGDFLFEKSEKKRIIELNQKSEKNLVLQKKRTENAIFIALSIIFFITALFVFFQYQTKRKSNLKLLKLNEELERKVENRTTSHLEAKQKAEENRANITAIIEGTNNTIWAFNRNYEILYINHTMKEDFLKTFGVLLEPGMNLVKSLPEILQPTWKPRYDRVLANEQFTVEDAVPTEEGTVYIQVSFNPIIKNGEVIGGSCFGSDITKRKLSELQLIEAKQKAEESEEKLKLIANSFVDGMIYQVAMLDEDKRKFNYISDTVTRLYGCTPEQAMKDPDLVYGKLHPDDVGDLIRKEKEALKKMSVFRTECRVINPDGSIRWSYYVSQPRVINGVVCWDGIEVDISNQKKIENELKKAKDTSESIAGKLKAALRSMSDAVFISDIDGNFINFNDAFVSFHRFKNREECVKTLKEYPLFLDVYHTNEEFVPIEMWVVSKALRGESGSNKEYILKRKDTGERWFGSYNFSPIRNNEGEIVGSVVTARDITELKRVEQQLIKAKEKAEESDRLKSAFLANMSHEIRAPMNGILGFTNLLQQRDLSGENQQKYIDIIQKSGDRMLNTVNDIIDISRIEAGLESYTVSEVNVNEQLNYYYSFFKPEAEKKGVKLQLNNNIEEVSVIKTDMDKFNSVLTNLIKNAIKYTDKGIIEFGYKIKTEEDKTELVFYVLDTGIGIPEFRQQAVFDRFVQADIEDKQAKQGSGLGLAITKAYVEMMGGKIWLESEEGKGSTFYFSIDYNLVNKKRPVYKSDNKLPKNDGDLSGKLNILVVEDDEISLDFISIVIKDYARKIQSVVSGIDAISECKKNPDIDLILMDIQLPGMNGYETTKEIRKFNKDVIIIAQTAYAMAGDKEKALKAGCNDYISKPINQTELEILFKKYSKKI